MQSIALLFRLAALKQKALFQKFACIRIGWILLDLLCYILTAAHWRSFGIIIQVLLSIDKGKFASKHFSRFCHPASMSSWTVFIVLTQGDHVLEGHGYVSITLSMSVPLESQIYKVTITILYFGINYFCVAAHLLFLKATKKKIINQNYLNSCLIKWKLTRCLW